jgi:hypothetical protein
MNKVPLSDNSGRWFDMETARAFEAEYFYHPNGDPERPICLATGSSYSSDVVFQPKWRTE